MWTKLQTWIWDVECIDTLIEAWEMDRDMDWEWTWIETWTWIDWDMDINWDMKHWLRLGHGLIETWTWIELRHGTLVETWTWIDWDMKHWLRLGHASHDLVLRPWKCFKTWLWNMESLRHGKIDTWVMTWTWIVTWIRTWKWIETWKYGDVGLRHGLRCGLMHGNIKTWVETWTWIETWKMNVWRDGLRHGHGSRPGKWMHGGMAWDMGWDTWTWIETWIWDVK